MKDTLDPGIKVFGSSSVRRATLKSQLADKLSQMIATGSIGHGEYLPSERKIAGALNVSRETVRGAMQILASKGLIEIAQGARTRVSGSKLGGLHDKNSNIEPEMFAGLGSDNQQLSEARKLIEVAVVRAAVMKVSQSELDAMSAQIDRQRSLLDDPVAFSAADIEFHRLVYKASGNEVLAKIAVDVYTSSTNTRGTVRRKESIAEHEIIYKALADRDLEAIEKAVLLHLENANKNR